MLAFGIRYLNGFVAASEPDNLELAEWPPHPGRVFMALAAAHFETGADPAERDALRWLEGIGRGGEISAPELVAAQHVQRAVVRHYVPVNDKAGPSKALLNSLPLTRERQDRVFARAWLEDEVVYLCWPDLEPPAPHRAALATLCSKISRIGHSSSLVQMWLPDPEEIPEPNWVPDDSRSVLRLRIAGPGTLDYLAQQYNAAGVEEYENLKVTEMTTDDPKTKRAVRKRLRDEYGNQPPAQQRPRLAIFQGYAPPSPGADSDSAAGTVFSPHLLLLKLGPKESPYRSLDLVSTLAVVNRWREAILSHSNGLPGHIRRLLSGHGANGGPTQDPHLAFLPLGFVGHEHADGHLLGMGLVFPDGLAGEDRREALKAVAPVRELRLGPLGVWHLESVTASRPPLNLRPEAWTAFPSGATHWSTVTPLVFDRHPKARDRAQYQREAAALIATACQRAGLPEPREVVVTMVSAHLGVPPAPAFPRLRRKDGTERRHSHAIVIFDAPVCGPVLVGAGRFRGYGAFRPMHIKDVAR